MRQQPHSYMTMILIVLSFTLLAGCTDESRLSEEVTKVEVAEVEAADPGLLRSIMVDLGGDMSDISRGLWLEDWPTVAAAAAAIAEHPRVSDTERARIQGALGVNFADFIQSDRRVHDTAVRLSAAAAAGELTATLDQLAELQVSCVACHEAFRERLR
jgi:cytochrome c556